ncbi:unnamed protein product [Mytilus coruscus]|uniref:Uncharacterized protein n=1 Tax=Mytilus coruscus TaxID=42192 RepID=A0A6J8BUB3_MYTCO|nr:unnamed protein product [Mytilus coruscus]
MSIQSSKIKHLYSYYMSKFSCKIVQLPLFHDAFKHDNKSTHMQCKICTSTLLMNLGHDAISGWLLLASFFFKTKQYNSAIYILQYPLSKCTSDKMQPLQKLSPTLKRLLNLNVIRKMTLVKLWKNLLINEVLFLKNSTLIPDVLKFEVESNDFQIPAVVYIHFLLFLCHYHLNNTMQCDASIRDLQLTIEESFFIASSTSKYISFSVLGIACQLKGDIESTKRIYWQSMRLQPEQELNSAFRRVALIC